jgi:hypothetical protein
MQRQRQHGTTSPDNAPSGLSLSIQQQEAATKLTRTQALAAIKSFFIKTIGRDGLKTFLKGCPKRSTSAVTSLRQNLLRQADQSLHQSINDAETVAALQQLADLNDLNYFLYKRPARDTVSVYREELIRQGHQNSFLVDQLHLLEQSDGLEQNPPEISFGTVEAITEALFEESFKTLHLLPTRELPSFFIPRKQ